MIKKPSGPTCDPYIAVTGAAAEGASLELRLCGFPTGHSELSPAHYDALWRYVYAPSFPAMGAWVDLLGYASKLQFSNENAGNNLDLSWARCLAVKRVLEPWFRGLGAKFRINIVKPQGDTESQDDPTLDHPFYRAVLVRLFTVGNYRYEPVKVDPQPMWQPTPSDQFEFEGSEAASVSGGVYEASAMIFAIHDTKNHRRRFYGCYGDGFSLSLPKMPPVMASAQHASSPVPFTTKVGFLDMKDFEGTGFFGGAPGVALGGSLGGWADFYIRPNLYQRRGITEPIHISFSFSRGFGVNIVNLDGVNIRMLSESFRPTVYSR